MATESVGKGSEMDKKKTRTYTITTKDGARMTVPKDVFLEELGMAWQAGATIRTGDQSVPESPAAS